MAPVSLEWLTESADEAERREWWRWTIAKDLAAGILANHQEMSGPESWVLGAVHIAGLLIAELEKSGEGK